MAWVVLKLGMSLFGVHLEVAQAEVKKDAGRMVTAVVLLGAAVLFLSFVLLILHAAAVMALYEQTQLAWYGSLLVVAGTDLALALLLVLVGRGMMKKPVLKETRGLIRGTVMALRQV